MNRHINEWFDAYVRDELQGMHLTQVEEHLLVCQDCRRALEEHRQLSSLLAEWISPAPSVPSRVFATRIQNQLLVTPEPAAWLQVLKKTWQLSPIGLIAMWSFGQAVIIITQIALLLGSSRQPVIADGLGLSGAINPTANVMAFIYRSASVLLEGSMSLPDWLVIGEEFIFGIVFSLGVSALAAVLLAGWVASWWVFRPTPEAVRG